MNLLKLLKIVLVVGLFFITILPAQNLLRQAPHKISKKDISSQEYKPVETSRNNYVLLQKEIGAIREYYLAAKENGFDFTAARKEKLFSFHKDDRVEFVQFSKSGEQVVFRREINEKKVWEIHDINTKKTKTIETLEGSINSASIYDFDNYLYIVSPQTERHKVYLTKNNNPLFVANGISMLWSPNGKYFLVLSPLSSSLSSREKFQFGQITFEEYQQEVSRLGAPKREIFRRYMIYNSEGEKLLILQDFDFVDWIQWSPDNNKIVLIERGDRGFKVAYLSGENQNISILKTFHFPGIPGTQGSRYPIWSPDGSNLMFKVIIEAETNQGLQEENLYVFNEKTQNYYPITSFTGNEIFDFKWLNNNTISFNGLNHITRNEIEQELTIEE